MESPPADDSDIAPFFGFFGIASAMIFAGVLLCSEVLVTEFSPVVLGAAYGTAKAAKGVSAMAVTRPELSMKALIPIIMAGAC